MAGERQVTDAVRAESGFWDDVLGFEWNILAIAISAFAAPLFEEIFPEFSAE